MTCFPRQILCCMLMRYIDQAQLWKTAGGLLMEQCGQCVGQEKNQRAIYNGHKRIHSIKFQSVALPNGLVGHFYGPVEGKRHDSGMLASSGLLQDLQRFNLQYKIDFLDRTKKCFLLVLISNVHKSIIVINTIETRLRPLPHVSGYF